MSRRIRFVTAILCYVTTSPSYGQSIPPPPPPAALPGVYVAPGSYVNASDGSVISGEQGVHIDDAWFLLRDGSITATTGDGAAGVFVENRGGASLENVDVKAEQIEAVGVRVRDGGDAQLMSGTITAAGVGVVLQGGNASLFMTDSALTSKQSAAIYAEGGNSSAWLFNSTAQGDTLVQVKNDTHGIGSDMFVGLDDGARALGRTDVDDKSTLTLQLSRNSEWTLRPSADGQTVSRLTYLYLNPLSDASVRFAPINPSQGYQQAPFQTLVLGAGDKQGWNDVYSAAQQPMDDSGAFGVSRIFMNTYFNAGGPLSNQYTDRLVINGDVSGYTRLHVTPVTGSPGADTGNSASDGISLVQVYGDAAKDSFVLAGEYVAVGPYQFRLHAFDPDESDAAQSDAHGAGGKFWDYRLQSLASLSGLGFSTFGFGLPGDPIVVPQLPSYVAAPTAIFQARLFDIDTWHRRLGDSRHRTGAIYAPDNTTKQRDFFLRTYGGKYTYRSQAGSSSYLSDTRYNAVQAGGNLIGNDAASATWRVGIAGSHGSLSFQPRDIDGNRKTRMKAWSLSPTFNWQHAQGAYVDALVAVGGFNGSVHTRQRGKTATLNGKSLAASVEAGMPFYLGNFTWLPQMQLVYQRLRFDNIRDVDNLDVAIGTVDQWTVRSGGEIRKSFEIAGGNAVQVYSKTHVAHTLNDSKKVQIGGRNFRTGQSGTVLETGVGFDAVFGKSRSVLYADVTRQWRLASSGHEGWTANVGVRVNF